MGLFFPLVLSERVEGANMWYTYILECRNGTLYTGITTDLKRRFKDHQKKTTHYTSYNPPKKIVYSESFQTKSKALKRESQIKVWTRRKKLALIGGNHQLLKKL
jgi:putative endonuclease